VSARVTATYRRCAAAIAALFRPPEPSLLGKVLILHVRTATFCAGALD
jgi:hypothetical protein